MKRKVKLVMQYIIYPRMEDMMFFIGDKRYELSTLNDHADGLLKNYQNKRKQLDESRFFAFFLPYTHNQSRLDNIQFIVNASTYLIKNKFNYSSWDESFRHKRYDRDVAPFIRKAILGLYLLELMTITESYSSEISVKTNSALGAIILDFFDIDKLSDIKTTTQKDFLCALLQYLRVAPSERALSFHPSLKPEQIIEKISSQIQILSVVEPDNTEMEASRSLAM